jgi:hypothetical protein
MTTTLETPRTEGRDYDYDKHVRKAEFIWRSSVTPKWLTKS